MTIEIRRIEADEHDRAIETCELAFSWPVRPEELETWKKFLEVDRTFVAVDGDVFVGTGANYTFELSVPGAFVPTAGLTMVGVLPSHRRRGVLTSLMKTFLEDARDHKEPISILWASESAIYQRFGYGLASRHMQIVAERAHMSFLDDPGAVGKLSLVSEDEAMKVIPGIYDRVRSVTPGLYARDENWWRNHRLFDPEHARDGASPMWRVILEIDDTPEAYALYRVQSNWVDGVPRGTAMVSETMSTTPQATRELWRFLFGVDLMDTVKGFFLPLDDPLPFMLEDPRRMVTRAQDNLWLRVVDVESALISRRYAAPDVLSIGIEDKLLASNSGTWRLDTREDQPTAERVETDADIVIDVKDLGATYLGGTSLSTLLRAGRVRELTQGAVSRYDAMFRSDRAPWCPEIF
jgi:predicted acetyltransferase